MPLVRGRLEDDRRLSGLSIEHEANNLTGHPAMLRLDGDRRQPSVQPKPDIVRRSTNKLDFRERHPECPATVRDSRPRLPRMKLPVPLARNGRITVSRSGQLDAPGKRVTGVPSPPVRRREIVPPVRMPQPHALPIRVVIHAIPSPECVNDVLVNVPDEEARLGKCLFSADTLTVLRQQVTGSNPIVSIEVTDIGSPIPDGVDAPSPGGIAMCQDGTERLSAI